MPGTAIIALVALLSACRSAVADFQVGEVQAKADGPALYLNGSLDLGLTSKVEEALNKGIPIDVVIAVRLYRKRTFLWDRNVASWAIRRQISYHALTGQYLVGGEPARTEDHESLNSLGEALTQLGALNDLKLPLPYTLPGNAVYTVEVRVNLDIEALPAPLRPVAYTSLAWHLNSGWTTWKVQP